LRLRKDNFDFLAGFDAFDFGQGSDSGDDFTAFADDFTHVFVGDADVDGNQVGVVGSFVYGHLIGVVDQSGD